MLNFNFIQILLIIFQDRTFLSPSLLFYRFFSRFLISFYLFFHFVQDFHPPLVSVLLSVPSAQHHSFSQSILASVFPLLLLIIHFNDKYFIAFDCYKSINKCCNVICVICCVTMGKTGEKSLTKE